MTCIIRPSIWLIVILCGLSQLSETVYTPSLPDIARDLLTSESMVEYTFTTYLVGFALGVLFWGQLSDKLGRKPCVVAGLFVFGLGCAFCYYSSTIQMLLISRIVQAFGTSIGSVLGQAICRDAFHGPALGKVYALIGSALALFPALGPLVGGVVAEMFHWKNIFIFLIIVTVILMFLVISQLQETHPHASRQRISIKTIAKRLSLDKNVLSLGFIVAGCNGILFSYFAEGSFCLIKVLELPPRYYGLSFIGLALSSMCGGIFSKKLHHYASSQSIMGYGLNIIVFSTTIWSCIALMNSYIGTISPHLMIFLIVLSQMCSSFGICMATSQALSLALVDYKYAIGTASSLFGFFYYVLISLFTFFMGFVHNGTLLPMPLYFCLLGYLMIMVNRVFLKN